MSLQSFGYFLFLVVVAAAYLLLPKKLQAPFLLAASWIFYLIALPALFPVLLALCLFTYGCGRGMEGPHRLAFVRLGVIGSLTVLCFFKYFNFLAQVFPWGIQLPQIAWPLGLSFYLFAAISYLVDVYREDCHVEHNFIRYALYLSLFATVTQGPICRAGDMLPQFESEHRFSAERTVQALRLFALGLFKTVAISDLLGVLVDRIFSGYAEFGGLMLILGSVGYTLQLYFNFCGYSELARATGLFLGLEITENFKTPLFSTNFSELWSRWHISLSTWLEDYLFTPLVWADLSGITKGKKRRLSPLFCLFCVFFLSGLWHGNTLPFLFWGIIQASYRIGEELLHRIFGKPKKKQPIWQLRGKRLAVFSLWCTSEIFFRIGMGPNPEPLGIADGFRYIGRTFCGLSPARFIKELSETVYGAFYSNSLMVVFYLAFLTVAIGFGLYLDCHRYFTCQNAPAEVALARHKHGGLYSSMLICFILVGFIMQNGGFSSSGFGMYAGF